MTQTPLHTMVRLAGALLAAGWLAAGLGCGLDIVGTLQCDMDRTSARVRRLSADDFSVLGYSYNFVCNSDTYTGTVRGSYNRKSQRVEEVLQNDNGRLIAVWSCPTDPWIIGEVRCRLVEQRASYMQEVADPPDATKVPYSTFSTFKLKAADRNLLSKLVGDLPPIMQAPRDENQTPPPPPPPPPKPDLAAVRADGRQASIFAGQTAQFDVVVGQFGPALTAPIEFTLTAGGAFTLEAARQTGSPVLETPPGFTCSGTGIVTCTGVLSGQATFRVLARAGRSGAGSITVNLDPGNAVNEADETNNAQTWTWDVR